MGGGGGAGTGWVGRKAEFLSSPLLLLSSAQPASSVFFFSSCNTPLSGLGQEKAPPLTCLHLSFGTLCALAGEKTFMAWHWCTLLCDKNFFILFWEKDKNFCTLPPRALLLFRITLNVRITLSNNDNVNNGNNEN